MGHLRAVRVLCAVDECGSFSAASRLLGMTQSAVSQHVATLEEHVGASLVDRRTRPAALTESGLALVRHGRVVLARLESAEQELLEIAGQSAGRLRFGSIPTALTSFVPLALARFRAVHPDVSLTVADLHFQQLLPRLEEGEFDVAVLYAHPLLREVAGSSLELTALVDDPFVLVLPVSHDRTSARGPVDLRDLARERWIGGTAGAGWWRIVRSECRACGFDPEVRFSSDQYAAVLAFVAAGLGVSVVPSLAVQTPWAGVAFRPLVAGPRRQIVAARPHDAFRPAAGDTMVRLLVEVTRRADGARRPRPGA